MCNGRSLKITLVSTCTGVVLCDACDRKDVEDIKKINVFGRLPYAANIEAKVPVLVALTKLEVNCLLKASAYGACLL